jgi:hypothetical protein
LSPALDIYDPSGIATYSQTGAHSGFAMLWTLACYLRARPSYLVEGEPFGLKYIANIFS